MKRRESAGEIHKTIKLFFQKPLTNRAFCVILDIEIRKETYYDLRNLRKEF